MRLLVDGADLAGFAKGITLDQQVEILESTPANCNGWRQFLYGLNSVTLNVDGFAAFDTTDIDALLPAGSTGQNVTTFNPINAGDTIGDPAFIMTARTMKRMPLAGAVGEVAGAGYDWAGVSRVVRAQVIHPLAARTATGSGTAATFTTPITGQSIYAAFHVTAVVGTGTITFTIQTDDNAGFTTPTTRYTSAALAAARTAEFGSVAGPFAGETHIRVGYTISGFTSVTFQVATGVS
jgi:hypothetical protein